MLKKIIMLWAVLCVFPLYALGFSEDNISAIEYSKYGVNYPYESLGERLNRLETDYFGMAQTGDIDSRIANLSKINKNARRGVNLPSNGNYYDTKPKSAIRNFWDNLTDVFSDNGYVTGYTPSMMNTTTTSGYMNDMYGNIPYNYMNNYPSYCPYNLPFNNRNPINNHGYYNHRYLSPSSSYNQTANFNGVSRFSPYHDNSRIYHHPRHNRNTNDAFVRPYTSRTTYYSPPNIQTKSSIHILED